jgi:hypothetical protein
VVVGLAGVLGIGTLFRNYLRKIVEDRLPPGRLPGLIRQRDLPLPAGERFVVLIADLQGDDDKRTHTRHVAAALEPYRGWRWCHSARGRNGASKAATPSRPKRGRCWPKGAAMS